MKDRFLFVNFKSYPQAIGKNAVGLAKKIEEASKGFGVNVVLVVQPTDIFRVSQAVSLPVFGQHFDSLGVGAFTGSISIEALKEAGAKGSVLNHAERKVSDETAKKCLDYAHSASFDVLLCAEDVLRAQILAFLNPVFLAFEPPELIGGDVSVSTAKPEIVKSFVQKIGEKNPRVSLLVGAGVKTGLDVKKSLEFGAKGVFVASGVVKAKDQSLAVKELLEGFE